jgi:hypothetical protein
MIDFNNKYFNLLYSDGGNPNWGVYINRFDLTGVIKINDITLLPTSTGNNIKLNEVTLTELMTLFNQAPTNCFHYYNGMLYILIEKNKFTNTNETLKYKMMILAKKIPVISNMSQTIEITPEEYKEFILYAIIESANIQNKLAPQNIYREYLNKKAN